MHIKNLFEKREFVFSFEIFPPKPTSPVDLIYKTLEELKGLKPDFISVTYGAGGSLVNNRTVELSSLVKNKYNIESVAHLTCIGSKSKEIDIILNELKKNGIENILALRGDIPTDGKLGGEFNHATELIEYIKNVGDFGISAACYPEGHLESDKDVDKDIEVLKLKEKAGATHFISQLYFDNEDFYRYAEKARNNGVVSPIQAGIMPVINKKQIKRITSLCGANIPKKFIKIMDKYEHDELALRDAGIAYAAEQMIDLISTGVDGIHLYTMNNPYVAKRIYNNIKSIVESVNREKCVISK